LPPSKNFELGLITLALSLAPASTFWPPARPQNQKFRPWPQLATAYAKALIYWL